MFELDAISAMTVSDLLPAEDEFEELQGQDNGVCSTVWTTVSERC